jgi:hypothetical protein
MAWWLPLAAGLAMYVQDVLATVMVVAESRGRAHLAAKAAVVLAVSAGNYAGTWTGVKLGHRLMPDGEAP